MSEAEEARVADITDQVPTFTEALGCVDCSRIYRHGAACPWCESKSILNVAAILSAAAITEDE